MKNNPPGAVGASRSLLHAGDGRGSWTTTSPLLLLLSLLPLLLVRASGRRGSFSLSSSHHLPRLLSLPTLLTRIEKHYDTSYFNSQTALKMFSRFWGGFHSLK